ncbi:hypothetical protein JW916_13775 [Candidatus Sumerlaeota bacterium]|nr:hypothetical protein [Candidatus Sumerlaeota bacterium]
MGVTIHYRGRLDDIAHLPKLCDELECFAEARGWTATRLDDDWDQPADARLEFDERGARIVGNLGLNGLLISPDDDTESIGFLFDRDGRLVSFMDKISIIEGSLQPDDAWVFVKTQFGSSGTHAWIVGLLRYVKKNYMSDLEVRDEGEYWETGDIGILKRKMDFIDKMIDEVAGNLSSCPVEDAASLSPEEIASKIEELLRCDEEDNADRKD